MDGLYHYRNDPLYEPEFTVLCVVWRFSENSNASESGFPGTERSNCRLLARVNVRYYTIPRIVHFLLDTNMTVWKRAGSTMFSQNPVTLNNRLLYSM